MCGLAGFAGIRSLKLRERLVYSLGFSIDDRGGHAAGYVSCVESGKPIVGRKLGYWYSAREAFIERAAQAGTVLMHSRFATCGSHTVENAHPFTIRRNNKVILHGAHNGILYNALESAKEHNRPYSVDSKELFELLADEDYKAIRNLEGYGVVTWVSADNPKGIYLSKLSSDGDIFVASLKGGGVVYGSTESIVKEALRFCRLRILGTFEVEVGRVLLINAEGVWKTKLDGVQVAAKRWNYWAGSGYDYMKEWEREEKEEEERYSREAMAWAAMIQKRQREENGEVAVVTGDDSHAVQDWLRDREKEDIEAETLDSDNFALTLDRLIDSHTSPRNVPRARVWGDTIDAEEDT